MDLIPAGKYVARAEHWKLGEASTGSEQVVVDFKFSDPALGSILWFGFFTEKTYERTVESLRHCGWKGTDVLELDTPQADLNANEVEIVVEHDTYKGKTSAKVAWVNNLSRAGVNVVAPLAIEKRTSFQQRMKANILAMEQGKPPAPKTQSGPPPGHPASADIPF